MSLFFSDLNLTEEKSHGCVAFSFCMIIFCFTLKNVLINQQKIVIMIYDNIIKIFMVKGEAEYIALYSADTL